MGRVAVLPIQIFAQSYLNYFATKIKDVNGNEINIYYKHNEGMQIDHIVDSVGRTINFNTQTINSAERLVSISGPGVSMSYTHTPGPVVTETFLTKAQPPVGNPWQYAYDQNLYEVTQLTTPSGGIINYAYDVVEVNMGWIFYYRTVIQKSTGGTVPAGTWNFAFSQGTNKDYTQVTDPCGRTIKYKYYGYGTQWPTGDMWKIGLQTYKEIVGEETETYDWTKSSAISYDDYKVYLIGSDYEVYVPLLTQKSTTRDGKTYTTNYSNYDAYANPQTISETGDKTRNKSISYWYNTSKNIVQNKPSSVTVSGGFSGTFTKSYSYDSNNGNLLQVNRYGVITNYSYWSNGNLHTYTDANGNTTSYQWSNGRISNITNPIYSVSHVINSNGTVASETNGRGYTTSFAYDANLRLTQIAPPGVNPTNFSYPADNSYKYESRGGYYIYHYNDGFGRPTGTLDIKGIDTDIVYKACDPKNYSTSNIGDTTYYDNFNRVTQITHKDGTSITYQYSNSNVSVWDEAGKNTYYTYNAFGDPDEKLLVSVRDALNYTTSYNYNILGSLTNITQGAFSRNFAYNSKNFLTSESHPEKGTTSYGRDNVGNMTSKSDSLGTTSYAYDALHRLRTINYGTGTITYTYDNANNRATMSNPSTSATYTYDASNRLTMKQETILSMLYTTQYGYDGNDNVTAISYPSGEYAGYTYNNKNEVTSVSGTGWSVNNMTYYTSGTPIGLPQSFTYSNGIATNLYYNSRNLTTGIYSSVLGLGYDYNSRGNMTSMSKNYLDPSNAPGSKLYELLHTIPGVPITYNYSSNRLYSLSGGQSYSLNYNADGDATYINDNTGTYDLQYDRLHKLTSFNSGGSPIASFGYDGDGMRVIKTSAEGTTVYHYDSSGMVLSETDSNGNRISDFVYANGKMVAKLSPTSLYFYHTDPAGTPMAMTDAGGNAVWRGDYLPFGEENLISGPVENDFRFVGKENDKETGLYYFGARYMEAMIGRFISPEPLGISKRDLLNPQGLNRYAYALNNPYRYLDPDGLIWATIEERERIFHNARKKTDKLKLILIFLRAFRDNYHIDDWGKDFADELKEAAKDPDYHRLGNERYLTQEWQRDPNDPPDSELEYGTRRTFIQTYKPDYVEELPNSTRKFHYDWFPKMDRRTYDDPPPGTEVKYDYSHVKPEDKKFFLKPEEIPRSGGGPRLFY
jgi:RHS repeat-associated protein